METFKLGLQDFFNSFNQREDFDSQKFLNLLSDTDEETVLRIMAIFNETLSRGVLVVEEAIKNDSADEVWKLAHKLAGTSELLGFVLLAKKSRDLSHDLRKDPNIQTHFSEITDFAKLAKNMSEDITKSCKALIKYHV